MTNTSEVVGGWIRQGADRYFLRYLLKTVREEEGMARERLHDARLREPITAFGRNLKRALRDLRRIDRLASVAAPTGAFILNEHFRKPLEFMIRSYPALGGKPLKHGRPSKGYLHWFTCVLADYLRVLKVPHRWEDIAAYAGDLGLAIQLDPEEIRKQCLRYRKAHPGALEKALEAARRHWGLD